MADNSQQILDDVIAQKRNEIAPELSEQEYFEIFCGEQILKDYDLSYDEILSGVVDGEHDGGIDSVYAFVNGEIVLEDFDVTPFKKDVYIELHLIQSKTSNSFGEDAINKLISTSRNLLKLDADYGSLGQYNDRLKSVMDNFRDAYRGLAARFPSLSIQYHYAAKRADASVHGNVLAKAEELKGVVRDLFADADIGVQFLGARKLLDLARRRPKTTYELKISNSLTAPNGYIVLANLVDYYGFLKGDGDKVKSELFESNVRDFQGNTEVNAEIEKTLKQDVGVDFWWMNNGVTILSSRATLNGNIVSIEAPQIVNGLQTSTQVARYFASGPEDEKRSVMVKIVSSEDDETRDKIIKATNSQNGVQPATLRATDKIQRDIEQNLKSVGLYYDRRKNFYKNEGKPADKIISIPLMAQAVMSLILNRPDTARARPSSLIKENTVYSQVFSETHPIGLYANAATMIRGVDRMLRAMPALTPRDRTNLRFYALYWLGGILSGKINPSAPEIAALDVKSISDSVLQGAIDAVGVRYAALGATDQIAKGPDLRKLTSDGLTELLAAA